MIRKFCIINFRHNISFILYGGKIVLINSKTNHSNQKIGFDVKKISWFLGLVICLLLIYFDQFTKYLAVVHLKDQPSFPIIKNVFEFNYLENRGAAFGIMQGRIQLFIPLTIIMCALFIFLYLKLPYEKKFSPLRIILCFIFSGAIGNFIDRITLGYVIDFLYFKLIDFPIFNVADIYITCSAFIFAFLIFFYYKEEDLDKIRLFKSRKE